MAPTRKEGSSQQARKKFKEGGEEGRRANARRQQAIGDPGGATSRHCTNENTRSEKVRKSHDWYAYNQSAAKHDTSRPVVSPEGLSLKDGWAVPATAAATALEVMNRGRNA